MRKSKQDILDSIGGSIRQSTIYTWLKCPRMFHLKFIEEIEESYRHSSMIHGTVLHRLIYHLHSGNWDMDIRKAYIELFEAVEAESEIPIYWKEDLSRLVENAVEIVEGYRNNPINRECEILFIEQKFKVKIAGYWFSGTLDQLRMQKDGTIELIDLKSNKQRPSVHYLINDWQLSLYSYAMKHGFIEMDGKWIKPRIKVTYASWYFLRGHEIRKRTTVNGKAGEQKGYPIIRTEKSIEDFRRFRDDVKSLMTVFLKDISYPNTFSCGFCNYSHICTDRKQLSSDLVEEAHKILEETWS